jgi:hypothetical protein
MQLKQRALAFAIDAVPQFQRGITRLSKGLGRALLPGKNAFADLRPQK